MSDPLLDSVVLITSSQPDNRSFGTGFPFYREGQATYIATCAHVVIDVGAESVIVDEKAQAKVIAIGSEGSIDMAVLCTTGLPEKAPLRLRVGAEEGKPFSTAGFRLPPRAKRYQLKPLSGTFIKQTHEVGFTDGKVIITWDVKIKDDYYQLEGGNSGSPVVDENGFVVSIVNTRQGEGNRGTAIAIEHLQEIWPEMPHNLFKQGTASIVENNILSPQARTAGENIPGKPQSHLQQMMQEYQKSQPSPRRQLGVSESTFAQTDPSLPEDVTGNSLISQLMESRQASAGLAPSHPAGAGETISGKIEEMTPSQPASPQTRGPQSPPRSASVQANLPQESPPQAMQKQTTESRSIDIQTLQKRVVLPFQIVAGLGLIGLIIDIVRVIWHLLPGWPWWNWILCLVLLFGGGLIGILLEDMAPEKFAKVMTNTLMTGAAIVFGGGVIGLIVDIVLVTQNHPPYWWVWAITIGAMFLGSLLASLSSIFEKKV